MRNRILYILLPVFLLPLWTHAQDSLLIDSLRKQFKILAYENSGNAGLQDSSLVYNLFYTAQAYGDNEPVQAMEYARKALSLAQKIGWKKGVAFTSNSVGIYYMNSGDYVEAEKYLQQA